MHTNVPYQTRLFHGMEDFQPVNMNPDFSALCGAANTALLGWVVDFYQRAFTADQTAQQFLQAIGPDHAEATKTHRLGFANRTLGTVLAATAEGRALRLRLQTLGVFRADSGHEHLNGCVVFPMSDAGGQVVQLHGYRLANAATTRFLSLPGTNRGVFNVAGLKAGSDWLVCSDVLDALTLWCHGHRQMTVVTGSELSADMRGLLADKRPAHVTWYEPER